MWNYVNSFDIRMHHILLYFPFNITYNKNIFRYDNININSFDMFDTVF